MTQVPILYRFRIELNDVDRGVYDSLNIRQGKHPSESNAYLLTRILAYALNYQPRLEFSAPGLADPDVPPLSVRNYQQEYELWIEIGNPSAKKLHRASKAAKKVVIYTYKDPLLLKREIVHQKIHRLEEIALYAIDSGFLESLSAELDRDVRWQLLMQEGVLTIHTAQRTFTTEIRQAQLLGTP